MNNFDLSRLLNRFANNRLLVNRSAINNTNNAINNQPFIQSSTPQVTHRIAMQSAELQMNTLRSV